MASANSLTASIALYNGENSIERAIRSIQNQTWKGSLEILVVDDCSTDNSADIVSKLAVHDKTIRLIRLEENVGLGAVRNIQIQEAKSEYLAFLDADDEWMYEKIERQFDVLFRTCHQYKTDNILCSVNLEYYNPDTNEKRDSIQPSEAYEMIDILQWGAKRPTPVIAACLGKTKTYASVGPFDRNLRKAQDWDYSIRFYENGGRFIFVPGPPLYKYYYSGANRDPVVTEQSLKYLFEKHADLFHKHDLYKEQFAGMLFNYLSQLYFINGRKFDAIQKMYEAANLHPTVYGNMFINKLFEMVDEKIEHIKYEMRIDRQFVRAIKRIFSHR